MRPIAKLVSLSRDGEAEGLVRKLVIINLLGQCPMLKVCRLCSLCMQQRGTSAWRSRLVSLLAFTKAIAAALSSWVGVGFNSNASELCLSNYKLFTSRV